MRRHLDQVIVREQVENGVTINNNLRVDLIDQQFVTPKKIIQSKYNHPWTKKRHVGHIMP